MDLIQNLVRELDQAGLWQKNLILNRHEFLNRQGEVDTRVFFVVSGGLRVFMQDGEEEHIIRFGFRNSFLLAMDSFLTGGPSTLYIQAIRKSEIRVMSKEIFQAFISQDMAHMRMMQQIMEMLVLQCLEREQDMLTASPAERYRRVFRRSPQLFQEIPGRYIASYLRMTPETFSRIKKS